METTRATVSRKDLGEQMLRELAANRAEVAALKKLFDEFARTFLNARFPFGRPNDRWSRR
jgi:hypothetical protein